MAKFKIIDRDMGYKHLVKQVKKLSKKPRVEAGLVREQGEIPKSNSNSLTVAAVALFNEFGLKVPERSFLRSTFDEQNKKWVRNLTNQINAVLYRGADAKTLLQKLGIFMEKDIKKKIMSGDFVPNAPRTIARKKSSKPLIDTSQMLTSIKNKVVM